MRNFWKNKIINKESDSKKNKKTKRIIRIILGVVGLFFIITATYRGYSLYNSLKETEFSNEFANNFEEVNTYRPYNSQEVFTVLAIYDWEIDDRLQVNAVSVIQVDKNAPEIRIISFHPDLYFRPYEYGNIVSSRHNNEIVKVKNLMTLGNLEVTPIPLTYTYYQMQELMAIKFDGYIFIDSTAEDTINDITQHSLPKEALQNSSDYANWAETMNNYWLESLRNVSLLRVLAVKGHLPLIKSNLTFEDWVFLIKDVNNIESDAVLNIKFEDAALIEVVDERGEIVDLLTEDAIDDVMVDFTGDIKVEREQCRVEVFNGSGVNGLGGRYGRWIDHLGVEVIRIGTAPGLQEKTVIYTTDKDEFDYTLNKIQKLWGEEIEIKQGRPDFLTTGDVIVVLGMDF
jgi:hypothetical protein